MKTTMLYGKEHVLTGKFTKAGKPRWRLHRYCEELELNDAPIVDDLDAWRAIDDAENKIRTVIHAATGGENAGAHTETVKDIMGNLKTLMAEYLKTRTAAQDQTGQAG